MFTLYLKQRSRELPSLLYRQFWNDEKGSLQFGQIQYILQYKGRNPEEWNKTGFIYSQK